MTMDFNQFINFFKYYSGEEHQKLGIARLFGSLPDELKSDDADWVKTYRNQRTAPAVLSLCPPGGLETLTSPRETTTATPGAHASRRPVRCS